MALKEVLASELNKLKKYVLIDIIINKSIPPGISVSEELWNHINFNLEVRENNVYSVYQHKNDVIQELKSELKCARIELEYSKKFIEELKRSVENQKLLIEELMTKDTKNMSSSQEQPNVTISKNHFDSQGEIPVARSSNVVTWNDMSYSEGKFQREVEKSYGKNYNQNRNFAVGTNGTWNNFVGIPKLCWFHLGRVSKSTNKDQIMEYLKNTFHRDDFVVEPLPLREDARSASFKIGADMTLLKDIYAEDKWPSNVTIRRFSFYRSKQFNIIYPRL